MKIYVFFVLILATLSCKPEVERSPIPALETFFGVFQSATDTSVLALSYSPSTFTFPQNTQITPITPSIIGTVTNCSVSPNLPIGLTLDPTTCIITGTPVVSQALTDYTITANNKNQSSVTTISISINASVATPTLPTVSFGSNSSSGLETANTISIPVTISTAADSTVTYSVTGTATSGIDFTMANGTLTFTSAGATTQNISFTVINDNLNELDETIVISLSAGSNSTIGANATYTYTILDEDPLPTINFTAATQSVTESIGTATITVQLSATSGKLITIPFAVNVSSTATGGGGDYALPASPLIIPAGGTSASISVTVTDDANFETSETVVIDLGTPINANAGPNIVHTLTITDNDPPPTVAFTTTASTNSESIATFTIPVSLSASSSQSISVDYSVTGGTATSGADFTLTSGTLTFASGIITQSISLNVNNDLKDELDETIILTLSNPTNTSLGANTTHTYTIIDDDLPPTVSFTSLSQSLSENGGTITVTAQLSAVSDLPVTVPFTVNAASSATGGGTDYSITASPLTIAVGSTTATITINLINDSIDEPDETIVIDIGNPTNATALGTISHTATITDDDATPTVSFTAASQSSSENGGTMTVTAQLSAASGFVVSVPFTINATSTATGGGTDYSITASPLSIPAGSTTTTITITPTNETLYEADETVIIDLGIPTNATLSGTTTHTATITNDDPLPTISFTSGTTISATENVGNYSLSVTLSAVSALAASVTLNTSNGTASSGSDYTAQTAQTITIPVGSTAATFNIPITDDTVYEGNETFTITLSTPVNSSISGGVIQTVTITDNDIGIASAETMDCAGNGKIDHYKITFTSAITDSSFPGYALNGVGTATSDWLVAGYTGVALDHGTSVNTACSVTDTADDSIIYIKFNEGAGFDTGVKPDLTTTATPIASGAVGNVPPIFTATVNEADTAKPIVTSVTPANGATSVLLTTNADVTFSEDMNTGTFNSTNFYLTGVASVLGTVSTISNTASRFDPTLLLAAFQSHTVTVSGMADVNGNTIVAFSSTFTTSPLNKVVGTVNSPTALPAGLTISNGTSSVNVTSGATSTAYQTAADLASGTNYTISITSQPLGQICSLIDTGTNLSGTAGTTDITVDVNCVNGYSVGGGGIQQNNLVSNKFHLYQGNVSLPVGTNTAGTADGNGNAAGFNIPIGITSDGQNFYVTDHMNNKIRKINAAGDVTTFAGNGTLGNTAGSGAIASLAAPRAITTDGTYLYVSEYRTTFGGHRIKRIRISTGHVETIAGDDSVVSPVGASLDGTGTAARFNQPAGMALENNILYIAERTASKIRKLDLSTKVVTTLSTAGSLNNPEGIVLVGGFLYVSNVNNHKIVRVDKITGAQTLFAGNVGGATGSADAVGTAAYFSFPHGITTDGSNLFVVDQGNNRIRQIDIATQRVSTIAGNGTAAQTNGIGNSASFSGPAHIFTDGKVLFVSDQHGIRKVTNNALVAYYPLSSNAKDYAGTNDGALNGGAAITGNSRFGITNQAIVLNGTTQNISASDTGLPTGNSSRTICSWIKPNSFPAANAYATFVSYGTQLNGQASGLGLYTNGSGVEGLSFMAWGAGDSFFVPFKVNTTTWTHICGTYNGTNASIFVNGKHIGSAAKTWNTNLGTFRIGSQINNLHYFNGSLSDIRIYSRVLNEGEINELAQDASPALVGASISSGATGLLGQYSFENGNLTNLGPLNNPLTITGAATSTGINGKDGDTNGAYNFAMASGQYLNSTSNGLPLGNGPRTLCAWVKPDKLPINSIITAYGTGSPNAAFGITMTSATQFKIWNWTAGDLAFTLPISIQLNTWQHFCATLDGANATAYYNGKSLGTQVFGTTVSTTLGVFRVGANVDSGNTFPGKIDDVRVYNNALSAIQVRQLATQVPMGLMGRYDFEGDTKDVSGFGVDGTISGTVTATTDRFGNPNSAYKFNGASKISTTIPATTQIDNVSLTAWVRPTSFVSGLQYIAVNGTGANGFGILVDGTTGILKGIASGGGGYIVSTVSPPLHVWSHVSLIRTNGTWDLLLNGKIVQTVIGATPSVPTGGVYMGSDANTGYINGEIDDIRVYNRNLAQSEILALSSYHPMQLASWNPSIGSSSLKLHLQADALSNLANNAVVTTWTDSAGGLQGTANGSPTFISNGINNRPAVNFVSASSQYFNFTGSVAQSSASSLFVVFQKDNVGFAGSLLTNMGMAGLYEWYFDVTNKFMIAKNGVSSMVLSNAFVNTTNPYLVSILHNQPTNTGRVYSSETDVFESGTFNQVPSGTPTNFNLGAPTCLCGFTFFSGKISELLLFHQELSNTDRLLLSCYLSAKYNIPVNAICP
ncbi:MAG: Ig-like domain-containing protein [Leptospiraceae bacterium]|nr:Ig-like domain-containing protein [Leptospiraceae bacterium]